ncbi:MAG: hypothetical protein P8X93_09925, partial [Gammaproteobacteria bacterium]
TEPHGNMRNPLDWLRRRWRFMVCYTILYPAALLPTAWMPRGDLIPRPSLDRIREHFSEDWKRCVDYAEHPVKVSVEQGTSPSRV